MDPLIIANKTFNSRLLLGTGKFASPQHLLSSIESAEAEIITVALRRVDLEDPNDQFIKIMDPKKYLFLANTSGARNAQEAIRIAKLALAFGVKWIKLEITPEQNYLMPDPIETLKAAEVLVKDGYVVLPYIHADPILAKRLEEVGVAAVMPLGAPIGSNLGLKSLEFLHIIIEQATVPVIIDAGLGTASHAAQALENGADAVLVNTAIATASNPELAAESFKLAVQAGRKAYLAQMPLQNNLAQASSPLTDFLYD